MKSAKADPVATTEWIEAVTTTVRLLEHVRMSITVHDLQTGSIVAANRATALELGLELGLEAPADVIDGIQDGVVDASVKERVIASIKDAARDGRSTWHDEVRFQRTDGTSAVMRCQRLVLRGPDGARRLLVTYGEVTRVGTNGFDPVGRFAPIGTQLDGALLFVVDGNLTLRWVDPSVARYGIDLGLIQGSSAAVLLHPDSYDVVLATIARVRDEGIDQITGRLKAISVDGTWCDYYTTLRPLHGSDEAPSYGVRLVPVRRVSQKQAQRFSPRMPIHSRRDEWVSSLARTIAAPVLAPIHVGMLLFDGSKIIATSKSFDVLFGGSALNLTLEDIAKHTDGQLRVAGTQPTMVADDGGVILTSGRARSLDGRSLSLDAAIARLIPSHGSCPVWLVYVWENQLPARPVYSGATRGEPTIWMTLDDELRIASVGIGNDLDGVDGSGLVGMHGWAGIHPEDLFPALALADQVLTGERDRAELPVRALGFNATWRARMLEFVRLASGNDACLLVGVRGIPEPAALDDLSPREREVFHALIAGDRVATIARRDFVAESTVRNHLSAIFRKLGVANQIELIERFGPAR